MAEANGLGELPAEVAANSDAVWRYAASNPDSPHKINIAEQGLAYDPSRRKVGITVVGAGMAGLLAAAMLRNQCEKVVEAAEELPNNHSAVLRFRSSVVADTLGIPFKKVTALKATHPWRNPIADAVAYSQKVTGIATARSILSANGAAERFIAPPDLVSRMAELVTAPIEYGSPFPFWIGDLPGPVISTIPMPILAKALNYPRLDKMDFRSQPGVNVIANVPSVDLYASLYIPCPTSFAARISMTGSRAMIEVYGKGIAKLLEADYQGRRDFVRNCLRSLGIEETEFFDVDVKQQQYAKILPIDEGERRRFIMWASERNIYSLGRFATWRPGLLLDDLVHDVRVIQRLIEDSGASYPHRKKD